MVNILIKQIKVAFYSEKITACSHDKKGIYKWPNTCLVTDRGSTSLPQTGSTTELTDMFSSFFIDKIQNIRRDFYTYQVHGIDHDVDTSSVITPRERFTHASEDEVKTLITKSLSKSYSLDQVPTWLLNMYVALLLLNQKQAGK